MLVKISIIENSYNLSDSERKTQLDETRNELKQNLEQIATQCHTDDKNFISIFNVHLGIKNETLEVLRYEYCTAKYIADNKFLEMGNVEINPHHIDTESVNCDNVIDMDRSKEENGLSDKLPAQEKECIMNAYKNDKIYELIIALKVANNLEFSRESRNLEINRISQKMTVFAFTPLLCSFDSE